ncbi:acyl-homoserine-lactone synthase [Mesorhizobium sp. SB112]|uniref:acyl-homoserine-lactone synthase n=1 Tax=Mesorhizobium sp. SB112 TaxID=3151853 RepID=UPI0032672CC9
MFRVHIVDWANRNKYKSYLEKYFRLRHRIYVAERGWDEISRPIDMEIDAFDTRDAIYLLGIDLNSEVVGGSRLVPSTKPHLLADVYPVLARGNPPKGEHVYEWTRFFVAPSLRTSGSRSRAAGIVLCALLEACLRLNIRQLSVVCEAFWPQRFKALGWNVVELGEILQQADGPIVGLLIDITPTALESTRDAYQIEESVVW